jgi:hypothetical protein
VYARVTLLEFDPVRFDVTAELDRFEESVLPALETQAGYDGALVLANDDARGVVVTLWTTKEDAERALAGGFWDSQVEQFVTVLASPPGRDGYDVVYADTPERVPA